MSLFYKLIYYFIISLFNKLIDNFVVVSTYAHAVYFLLSVFLTSRYENMYKNIFWIDVGMYTER